MKQIVVFPRGQLTDKDRRAMQRHGVCVVEADDPSKVIQILPTPPLQADELLAIALESMQACTTDNPAKPFLVKLTNLVKERLRGEVGT